MNICKFYDKIMSVTSAILLIALLLTFVSCSKSDPDIPASGETVPIVSDSPVQAGDPADDPENIDLPGDDGADVKAQDLSVESGRSNGIDVSKWQGKIDWREVKKSGIEFAFIRIGYRGENSTIYKDDNADYNIQQAQDAGVLVGVYFFSTAANESEAEEEALWTLRAIEGYAISYPVVYDCEGYRLTSSRMYSLSAAERTGNALAFLKTVANAGYDAMFYGARNEIEDPAYWDMARIQGTYKVWVAQYPEITYPAKDKPDYSGRYDAWQYTNKGTVGGAAGNVDMVVCYFTKEKAEPMNASAAPGTASVPLTDEEKIYNAVCEAVTAKELTNLREAATTKSSIVATLKNGETAERIGIGTNGWSKLRYNGQIVYAISSYLTTELSAETAETPEKDIVAGNTFEPKADRVTAKQVVNLRTLPTTDSEIVGSLKSGEFLDRTAVSNKGWSRLIYGGTEVYAVTSYLTNEVIIPSTEPHDEVPVSDGFTAVDEQVTAKLETNLRTAPSTANSEVVYTLKNGEYVRRIGINSSSGWSKLEYNGQVVYAISSYLVVQGESDS